MTNREIRQWYIQEVRKIPELDAEWKQQGHSAEERARRAWNLRHRARLAARQMMEDPEEVEQLRRRDLAKYRNPDGPTFEQLAAELKRRFSGDALFEEIIRMAARTDPQADRGFV